MDDSVPVEVDLSTFEKDLFNPGESPDEKEVKSEEVSENTPSATNESEESEAPAEDETDGEDTAAEQDEQEPEKAKKRRRNAQDRIDELTQDKYELKRRIAELERLGQKPEETPTKAPVTPVADKAPSPDAMKDDGSPLYPLGEFDPQYITDLTRHTIRQENAAAKAEEAKKEQSKSVEMAQRELTQNWATKVQAAAERLPDLPQKFATLSEAFSDIPEEQGNFIASSIMSLENGPDVLSYFADNLDQAKSLLTGGIFETVIALGRLDGEFSARNKGVEKGSETPVVSQAPSPPPVSTKGSSKGRPLDPRQLDDFEKIFFSK